VVLVVPPPPAVVLVVPPLLAVELVVPPPPLVLLVKLLVMVAVQVTTLAPVVPAWSHWVIVVGKPVDWDAGAVTVQLRAPAAPPELLH